MGSIFRRALCGFSISSSRRMSTATAPTTSVISPSKIQIKASSFSSSPLLMLPPTNPDGRIAYNFFSFAENRVLTRPQMTGLMGLAPIPIRDLRFCGCSHGWIALFKPRTLDLFLYNPVSLRHINLPPIRNLPNFPDKRHNINCVIKVVLSCSPDEGQGGGCRAVMIYNCTHDVAFCCPGRRGDEWTPIGKTYYEDIVYSSRQRLFFGLNQDCELETWDLSYPSSPRMIKMIKTCGDEPGELPPKDSPWPIDYLVVADDEDHLLVVTRSVIEQVTPDGSLIDFYDPPSDFYSHMTDVFDIAVYDPEEGDLKGPLESLGDLALFVGSHCDSVALPASRFPELKPNSIYFTDPVIGTRVGDDADVVSSGQDIGIFDYGNKTVSRSCYPCDLEDVERIEPSSSMWLEPTMWFFPTGRFQI